MHSILPSAILLCIIVMIAGCTIPAKDATGEQHTPSMDPITPPVTNLADSLTITPDTEFLYPLRTVPVPYQSGMTRGAFENSFIHSYECTDGIESFMTNYTLFSGNTSPHHIRYTLVTVDNTDYDKEIFLSSDILNASVAPDDFISRPGQIYRSRVLITLGPNVTGESHTNPDGSGWSRNPYFSFRLKVTVDGSDAPEAEDQIAVIKWCNIHSQTRNMQGSPSFQWTPESDIIMKPGEMQQVNLTVRNYGGGIRELSFAIPARLAGTSFSFPLEAAPDQLLPLPPGLVFTFDPPVMDGNNFRLVNDTLLIRSDPGIPRGNYSFPLVLCYRNLAVDNTTSVHFPFDDTLYCNSATRFTVNIV